MEKILQLIGKSGATKVQHQKLQKVSHLLEIQHTDKVLIELTSRCNLKCPFCTVSHPDYRGGDNTLSIEDLIPKLKQRGVRRVEINNHGESTIIPKWEKTAQKLIENGFSVSITSNLAKVFTEEEIETLAKMTVYLSIDTVDSELFRKLRLGARLDRVIGNVEQIQKKKLDVKSTKSFGWRVILCDATCFGIPALVEQGLSLGISEFYFGQLQKMMDVKTTFEVHHVLKMSEEKINDAISVLRGVVCRLNEAQVTHDLDSCVQQLLDARNAQTIAYENPAPDTSSPFEPAVRLSFNEEVPLDWTRNCLLPWNMLQIKHNQNVTFCCWMKSLGNLKTESLDFVLNGERAKMYREGLLTGKLMPECKVCPVRKPIPLKYQSENVQDYLNSEKELSE